MPGSDDRGPSEGAILEVAPEGAPSAGRPPHGPTQPSEPSAGAVLEVAGDALATALAAGPSQPIAGSPDEPRKRASGAGAWKKRAEPSDQDALVQRQLAKLLAPAEPTLSILWPDLTARDLLTEAKPAPELFARRWSELQGSIDAVARKGFEQRNQAAVAQAALDKRRAQLAQRARKSDPSLPESPAMEALALVAVDELAEHRDREFVQWASGLAGASRTLYAQDLARIEEDASARGIDRERSHALLRSEGLALQEGSARAWSACAALPGGPSSLDAAGAALLENPAHGYAAIKRGDLDQWLAGNDAPASVADSAKEIRRLADRGSSESHIVHTLAWLFGRSEIVLGRAWVRTPSELGPQVRAGTVTTDDLARAARERVLGAWLRRAGFTAAATAADALGRGEELGLERLAWALGEPLRIGDLAFTDPVTLAKTALSTATTREPLVRSFTSGELLAWMESLPPSRRDERWIERLRRAKSQANSDARALWAGVYSALGTSAKLEVRSANGSTIELTGLRQLTSTLELAAVWDGLKQSYRTGELLAWIAAVSPENDYVDQERPADDDAGLNELLWELGHTGLVLEWGKEDQAITSPDDLIRSYRLDWRWFEAQLRRGYVLRWLERFHGKRMVGGVTMDVLLERLRVEIPTLPSGFVALKTALLCGLRQIPLDPCEPGDPATMMGYVGAGAIPASAESWEPLRAHMTWGAGHLWVAQLPNVKASTLPLLMNSAFAAGPNAMRDAPDRLLRALAASLGGPVPSPALAAKLGRVTSVPQTQQQQQQQGPFTPQPQQPQRPQQQQGTTKAQSGSGAFGSVMMLLLLAGAAGAGLYVAKEKGLLTRWLNPPRNPATRPSARTIDTPSCALSGAALDLGAGLIAERGIHVVSLLDEVDVAWVQSPVGARASGDGVSWARITGRGTIERGTLASDRLDMPPARDQRRTVYRAFATHSTARGEPSLVVDQLLTQGTRREVLGCGPLRAAQQFAGGRASQRAAAARDPLADAPASEPNYTSMFFCRTAGEVTQQVIGARGVTDRRGRLSGAELVLTASTPGATPRVLAPWPVLPARVLAAANPMEELRNQGPASAESARAGAWQAIAVTGRERVYAWLVDTSHRSVVDAVMLSRESTPGPARVAVGPHEALVVWVDRHSSGRSLFAARLQFDGRTAIGALTGLGGGAEDPVAPSVAALPDGDWLVAWVQRRSATTPRSAWLQRYDRALQPVGTALEVSRGESVSTARLAYDSVMGFTVVYATEASGGTVLAARGRCP